MNKDLWFSQGISTLSCDLLLSGDVDLELADKTYKFLRAIGPKKRKVTIVLNSDGGSCDQGFAIYDLLSCSKHQVTIVAIGSCMSMATIILQAADLRLSLPSTTFMVHDGHDHIPAIRSNDLKHYSEHSDLIRRKTHKIYAERSNVTEKEWEKYCANDTYFTSEEALEKGLIDGIIRKI